ncbi:uncharacterized protein BT62DRAFT_1005769 [Guyanagaster necrorhizus]|uniref:Uncharacterized protein n=1 Tax=Guyanagaster necrorhizus TaxID=856835 RepID=A0A9P7VS75_9AGAR|nr:uncharacterized protein BT62DRAFT_1005769 [Guyanagaster necrorhizus MCA 3950]KAG7446473.1 hypothetical protein BT62DRAFT_1005769 [Guyanagaster necrorhizus MCA 3950]
MPQAVFQSNGSSVPPNSVATSWSTAAWGYRTTFAVLGTNATFCENAFSADEFFNPTNSSPPFFQIFDALFINVLGGSLTEEVFFCREIQPTPIVGPFGFPLFIVKCLAIATIFFSSPVVPQSFTTIRVKTEIVVY